MSREINSEAIIKLRFKQPSGYSYPDWEEVKLNTLANLVIIKNKTFSVKRVLTNSAADGIVDQRDYFEKDIANSNNLDGYFVVERGDYVYNPRISNIAPVGPVSKNGIGIGVMSPLYTVFRFISSENDFYEQYFKTSHWYQYLRFMSNSGARFDRMSITPSVFMNMPVPFPKPDEQQKIADCLSSLDDLITTQKQKLEALKTHKKGLMQQLFPAESETVPKLRFKEFRESEEWEEETLGNLVDIRSGISPSCYNLTRIGNYPFFKVEDLNNCTKYQVISREYSNDSNNTIPTKSVIFPKRGAAILLNKVRINRSEVLMDTNLMAITPNNKVEVEFLYYQVVRVGLFKIADTSTIPQINNKHILPYNLLLPSKSEQRKIANTLSSLDELLTAQKEKIEELKQHKKGLMQALFPCDY